MPKPEWNLIPQARQPLAPTGGLIRVFAFLIKSSSREAGKIRRSGRIRTLSIAETTAQGRLPVIPARPLQAKADAESAGILRPPFGLAT
jgi:hypothetical protein